MFLTNKFRFRLSGSAEGRPESLSPSLNFHPEARLSYHPYPSFSYPFSYLPYIPPHPLPYPSTPFRNPLSLPSRAKLLTPARHNVVDCSSFFSIIEAQHGDRLQDSMRQR